MNGLKIKFKNNIALDHIVNDNNNTRNPKSNLDILENRVVLGKGVYRDLMILYGKIVYLGF